MAELLTVTGREHEVALAADRSRLTWDALNRRVNRWIAVLRAGGLRAGDRVAVVAGNTIPTYEVVLACVHTGLLVVPVNWHLTATEMAHLLRDSGSRGLVADRRHAVRAGQAAAESATAARLRVVFGEQPLGGLQPAAPLLGRVPDTEPADQSCGGLLLYTSGTTGTPRGVLSGLLTPGSPLRHTRRTLTALGASPITLPDRDPVLLTGPWYHAAQLFFSLFPLLRGARLVMRERFAAAELLTVLDAERIACTHLVPTQFTRLLRLPADTRAGFSAPALRRVWHGGGPCAERTKRAMIDWWGPVFTEYYGATEAGLITTIDSRDWLARPGSVGRAIGSTTLRILDSEGRALPSGQRGRVFIERPARGPTPAAVTCGDLGYLDDDGYLYLTGRAAGSIVSGGVIVHPAEVEATLRGHPEVVDAAVFGVPDEEFGQRVTAAVEVAPSTRPGPELAADLDAHCRRTLAGFKVPRDYEFVAELPRDGTGKLRAAAWAPRAPEPGGQ